MRVWLNIAITYLAIQITININPSKNITVLTSLTLLSIPFIGFFFFGWRWRSRRSSQSQKDIIILRQEKGATHKYRIHNLWSSFSMTLNKTKGWNDTESLVNATFLFSKNATLLIWCAYERVFRLENSVLFYSFFKFIWIYIRFKIYCHYSKYHFIFASSFSRFRDEKQIRSVWLFLSWIHSSLCVGRVLNDFQWKSGRNQKQPSNVRR